jgi:hypothetical protein
MIFITLINIIIISDLICQEIGKAFYIAPENDKITFFKINITPTIIDTNTTIRLYERQILMPWNIDSQGIAVLEDINILTNGFKIYKHVGFGVCINPKTDYRVDLPRDIPGEKVILFDTDNINQNRMDWNRAKSVFERIDKENIKTVNVNYKIFPKYPQWALIVPIKITASNLSEAAIQANEELERFYHAKDKSWIIELLKIRLGNIRTEQLSSAKLEYCKQSKINNRFIAVFKVM